MTMTTTNDEGARTAKKRSERTCAGCGKHAAPEELVRVVHDPSSGALAVDLAASAFGRGAHVHSSPDCLARAFRGGFARVFGAKVVGEPAELAEAIVSAADRRIEGLVMGARRAGQLASGSDAVVEALEEARAALVIVARDAAAAARLGPIERAIAAGAAVAFGDKQRLGALLSRDEVALVAILHPGVAASIARAYQMSGPFRLGSQSVAPACLESASGANPPREVDGRRRDVGSEEAWSEVR